jgi:hypothetical protein
MLSGETQVPCRWKWAKSCLMLSDFESTLSSTSSGRVLSQQVGISDQAFEKKIARLHEQNLVQPEGELAYLLLHDPDYQSRVRKAHLEQAGKEAVVRKNARRFVSLLHDTLIDTLHFDFHAISPIPGELGVSALENVVPPEHIHATELLYNASGQAGSLTCVNAGYGKVTVLESIERTVSAELTYLGGSLSDVHAMLYVNAGNGLTIATSEGECVIQVAQHVAPGDDAMRLLPPILENVVGWSGAQITGFLAAQGMSA